MALLLGKNAPCVCGGVAYRRTSMMAVSHDLIGPQDATVAAMPSLQSILINKDIDWNNSKQDGSASSIKPAASTVPQPQQTLSRHELSYDADDDYMLPVWAEQFMRQVPSLPNGRRALLQLLSAVQAIHARAEDSSAANRTVVQAYVQLALIDLTAHAWQQRLEELEEALGKDPSNQMYCHEHQEARMALCGCRYLRISAVNELAQQVHQLLDQEGHHPDLNLAALPQPHTIGLNFSQVLQQGLGLNPESPAIRSLTEQEVQELQHLPFEAYHAKASLASMCGDWEYCYWSNQASFVPAPYAKFGTKELAGLLKPEVVLSSLHNGVWGRLVMAAGRGVGLALDRHTALGAAERPEAVMAGAGSVGSASAWLFLQHKLSDPKGGLVKMRSFALAVTAAAVAVLQHASSKAA